MGFKGGEAGETPQRRPSHRPQTPQRLKYTGTCAWGLTLAREAGMVPSVHWGREGVRPGGSQGMMWVYVCEGEKVLKSSKKLSLGLLLPNSS